MRYNLKYINQLILTNFPHIQAIYLFGSAATESEWFNSDIDIALLLPHQEANQVFFA